MDIGNEKQLEVEAQGLVVEHKQSTAAHWEILRQMEISNPASAHATFAVAAIQIRSNHGRVRRLDFR